MKMIKIRVVSFDEHNEKAIGKVLPWFRCQSRLARSSKFLALSPGAKHMWLWLLCESAQSCSREVLVCPRDVSREVHVKPQNIPSVISELLRLEWIQVLSPEKWPYVTNERTNETDETKIPVGVTTKKPEPEFKLEPEPKPEKKKQRQAVPVAPDGTNLVIAAYCDAWKSRYKADRAPPIEPRHAKNLKSILAQVGMDRAIKLVQAYLAMPDQWFVTKRHDLGTFLANLTSVTHFVETGKVITRRETQQLDAMTTNQNTLEALRGGQI